MIPDEKGVNTTNPNPVEANTGHVEIENEKETMVNSKYPQMRESLRWQIEGSKDKFLDGLESTASRPIKRPISEKFQIVMSEFHEYPRLELRFNEYELT